MTPKQKPKRLAPVPVRFSADDLARLDRDRAAMPRSAYIKWRVFDPATPPPRSRIKQPKADVQRLGQILAYIGRVAGSLNQIAKAINTGSYAVSPEAEALLRHTRAEIVELRRMVMAALGREDGAL